MSNREADIRVQVSQLTVFILSLNALIDTGRYKHVTIEEVNKQIDEGTIVQYIQNLLTEANIMSPYLDEAEVKAITDALQSLLDAYGGSERRKWVVENSGLNLMLAWITEMIQQGVGQQTVSLPWAHR